MKYWLLWKIYFEKCTVAMLGGPCSQHVKGNTSRLNQPQSAIIRCMPVFSFNGAVTTCSWSSPTKPQYTGRRHLYGSVSFKTMGRPIVCWLLIRLRCMMKIMLIKWGPSWRGVHALWPSPPTIWPYWMPATTCLLMVSAASSISTYINLQWPRLPGWKILFTLQICRKSDQAEQHPATLLDALYFSLRGANTLEEGLGLAQGWQNYVELWWLWAHEGMILLRDLLVHYSDCDAVPFLMAQQKQCDNCKEVELDMLKDGPFLPSIGMCCSMRGSAGLFHTFSPNQADLAKLMNTAIIQTTRRGRHHHHLCVCLHQVAYDSVPVWPVGRESTCTTDAESLFTQTLIAIV